MPKVAIVDDDPELLRITRLFLESKKIPVLGCYLSLGQFYEKVELASKEDNIIILDIEIAAVNGIDHILKIKRLLPGVRIIIYSGHANQDYLREAIEKGASAYLIKGGDPRKLLQAIETVREGGVYLDSDLSPAIFSILQPQNEPLASPIQNPIDGWALNLREKQVLRGLLEGKTYQEIGDDNNISINTVRHYVQTLYRKADVTNKVELIRKIQGT